MSSRGDQRDAHAPTVKYASHGGNDATVEQLYGRDFGAGAVVGEYIVEERTSRGGFAVIYRAVHPVTGQSVALKVLRRDLASTETLRRFDREADTLKRLHHPNIVQFLDYGQLTSGQPYLVLEWIEGRTLAAELRARGPLAPTDALAILEELGAALEAAHELGIVHRDIKAENVMATPSGDWFTVKLLDFGIVKLILPELCCDQTSTVGVVGTPLTMAPEQILGEEVDVRTDIYGLGLLLYQLVTGRLPFWGTTPMEVEELHLHAPPPLASSLAPVSEAFDAVVARCLEKRMEARYPTVADLLADLRAAVAGRPGAVTAAPWALGVHVEANIDGELEDPDDDVLDDVDHVLTLAREALTEANMAIALESGNALLAAVTLPAADKARTELRVQVLASALELGRCLEARGGRSEHVRVAVTVHMASAAVRVSDPSRVSGDLLRLSEWTAGHPGVGVVATTAAVAGLEDRFSLEELPERSDRLRLTGRRAERAGYFKP